MCQLYRTPLVDANEKISAESLHSGTLNTHDFVGSQDPI